MLGAEVQHFLGRINPGELCSDDGAGLADEITRLEGERLDGKSDDGECAAGLEQTEVGIDVMGADTVLRIMSKDILIALKALVSVDEAKASAPSRLASASLPGEC